MPNLRQIRTCSRCRLLKIRCDKTKPSCERCNRAKVDCSLRSDGLAQAIAASVPNPLVIESNAASRTSPMRSEPSAEQTSSPGAHSAPSSETSTSKLQDTKAIKRRQRALLSFTRCHRLKVGCSRRGAHGAEERHTGKPS